MLRKIIDNSFKARLASSCNLQQSGNVTNFPVFCCKNTLDKIAINSFILILIVICFTILDIVKRFADSPQSVCDMTW